MANPIVRGFRSIARFSGRDTRGQFWPYAGVVIALVFAASGGVMAVVMNEIFVEMHQFALDHPEAATVHSSPGNYSISIDSSHPEAPMPDMGPFIATLAATVLVAVVLLAAAVSRRLHDSGRAAFWGLMPLPFLAFGLTAFPMMMRSMETQAPDVALFLMLFVNNLIYMIVLVSLIVLLCLRGAAGPNRYGPEPDPNARA